MNSIQTDLRKLEDYTSAANLHTTWKIRNDSIIKSGLYSERKEARNDANKLSEYILTIGLNMKLL